MKNPFKLILVPTEIPSNLTLLKTDDVGMNWKTLDENKEVIQSKGKLFIKDKERVYDKASFQDQLLCIVSNEELKAGNYCLFYGQLSKVLKVAGTSVKIETTTVVTKEDAELINSIKGKETTKEGDFSKMVHSFSIAQLPKVIACSDRSVCPREWIDINKLTWIVDRYNENKILPNVELELLGKFIDHVEGDHVRVGTDTDGAVIIKKTKKISYPYRVGRKQKRAILDAQGLEVIVFAVGRENEAQEYCDFLNQKHKPE